MENSDNILILWPNEKGKFSLKPCRQSYHGIKGCYAVSEDSRFGYSVSANGHLFLLKTFEGTDDERYCASQKWIDSKEYA